MTNGYGRGPTYEPGAYGGAWTLASCVQFAAHGIDRVFHWEDSEKLTAAGDSLYFSSAWVMVAARRLFGTSSTANVSVLVAPNGAGGRGRPPTLAMLPQKIESTGLVGSSPCSMMTSASGIGGLLGLATDGSAGAEKSGIGLLVSVFNRRKDCTDETSVRVSFQCPATITCAQSVGAKGTVRVMILNHTSSVYEQIMQDAGEHEGWLSYGDGEIYPLAGPTKASMLTPTGMLGVTAKAQHWLSQQSKLFTPRLLDASDGVTVECSDDACTLTLVAKPPSVYAVFVGIA